MDEQKINYDHKDKEVVKDLQKHVSFPDVENIDVRFMARTGKYEAREHIARAKRMSILDDCSDTVLCMVQIFRVDGDGREKPEDSLCFEATFPTPCGKRWNKIDACSYFGSLEWLDDYAIKPFQKRMDFVWDNQD